MPGVLGKPDNGTNLNRAKVRALFWRADWCGERRRKSDHRCQKPG
jgi:hypothetical protein